MKTLERDAVETRPASAINAGEKCCGACANKASLRNAHCGKIHSIEELVRTGGDINNFYLNRWQVDSLVDYVYNEHHQYFYKEEPVISDLLAHAANHPASGSPELLRIHDLFAVLKKEFIAHLRIEETVLFPYIKRLVAAKRNSVSLLPGGINDIAGAVRVMVDEHRSCEQLLAEIELTSNHFEASPNAPVSVRLLFEKLKAMHRNLDQHMFIENNIVYPKALQMDRELKQPGLSEANLPIDQLTSAGLE